MMRNPFLLVTGGYIYLFDNILGVKLVTGTFITTVVSILSFCAFLFVSVCEMGNDLVASKSVLLFNKTVL
jgi:hypothetical protein